MKNYTFNQTLCPPTNILAVRDSQEDTPHRQATYSEFPLPPCVPTMVFKSPRQDLSHTQNSLHGTGCFDMLHVTGVSADFSVFRKNTFMSQSGFLSVLANQYEPFRFK